MSALLGAYSGWPAQTRCCCRCALRRGVPGRRLEAGSAQLRLGEGAALLAPAPRPAPPGRAGRPAAAHLALPGRRRGAPHIHPHTQVRAWRQRGPSLCPQQRGPLCRPRRPDPPTPPSPLLQERDRHPEARHQQPAPPDGTAARGASGCCCCRRCGCGGRRRRAASGAALEGAPLHDRPGWVPRWWGGLGARAAAAAAAAAAVQAAAASCRQLQRRSAACGAIGQRGCAEWGEPCWRRMVGLALFWRLAAGQELRQRALPRTD
jgi:hypothetical protein